MGWDVPKATFLDDWSNFTRVHTTFFSTMDTFFEPLVILGSEKVGSWGKCRLNPYLSRKEPVIIP